MKIMGLILLLVASILKWVLTPVAYTFGFIASIQNAEFNKYNRDLAVEKDKYGNILCQYLFNDALIKSSGSPFGNGDETISSVLGVNEYYGTLTFFGKFVVVILNTLQKNHCRNAINRKIHTEIQ